MTLRAAFQSLPGGPRHLGSVVLGIHGQQIEVRVTNSNHQRLAQ